MSERPPEKLFGWTRADWMSDRDWSIIKIMIYGGVLPSTMGGASVFTDGGGRLITSLEDHLKELLDYFSGNDDDPTGGATGEGGFNPQFTIGPTGWDQFTEGLKNADDLLLLMGGSVLLAGTIYFVARGIGSGESSRSYATA